MKVQLFAINHSWNIGFENLGIERISAYLNLNNVPASVNYLYYTENVDKAFESIDLNSEIFGFSVYSENMDFSLKMAEKIKENKPNAVVFWGSRFVTDAAQMIICECYNYVDFLVLGHGEYAILDFTKKYISGFSIESIIEENPHLLSIYDNKNKYADNIDIKMLPWPERNFLSQHKSLHAYIADAHDCTGRCSFCSGNTKKWTGRAAEDIFKEVVHVFNTTKIRSFFFTSGSFEDPGIRGKNKIREFCELVIKYNEPLAFGCYLRAESFKNKEEDRELLQLMKKAGFYNVFVGIESGNEEDLILFNKRATLDDNLNCLKLFKEMEIFNNYGFIMLNPYSNVEKISKNFFLLANDGNFLLQKYINRLCVYYNTPIYCKLKNEGLLKPDYSYKNIYSYYNCDPIIDSIYNFIDDYFKPYSDIMRSYVHFADNVHFYYFALIILKSEIDEKVIEECENILMEIAGVLKDYFFSLYVRVNIEKCKNNYASFRKNSSRNTTSLKILKTRKY